MFNKHTFKMYLIAYKILVIILNKSLNHSHSLPTLSCKHTRTLADWTLQGEREREREGGGEKKGRRKREREREKIARKERERESER